MTAADSHAGRAARPARWSRLPALLPVHPPLAELGAGGGEGVEGVRVLVVVVLNRLPKLVKNNILEKRHNSRVSMIIRTKFGNKQLFGLVVQQTKPMVEKAAVLRCLVIPGEAESEPVLVILRVGAAQERPARDLAQEVGTCHQ